MENCNSEFGGHILWNTQPVPKISQPEESTGNDEYGAIVVFAVFVSNPRASRRLCVHLAVYACISPSMRASRRLCAHIVVLGFTSVETLLERWEYCPVCVGCGQEIFDMTMQTTEKGTWHASCLCCSVCGAELTHTGISRGGVLYCTDDFNRCPLQIGDQFYVRHDDKLLCIRHKSGRVHTASEEPDSTVTMEDGAFSLGCSPAVNDYLPYDWSALISSSDGCGSGTNQHKSANSEAYKTS
ncbi:hypothetical protein ScPMuIL_011090 [Solemya velum]